jgi:hypothetical protein
MDKDRLASATHSTAFGITRGFTVAGAWMEWRSLICINETFRGSSPLMPLAVLATFHRPVTRTRARSSRSIFAVASPMPLVPPMITARFALHRSMLNLLATSGRLVNFELLCMIIRRGGLRSRNFRTSYFRILQDPSALPRDTALKDAGLDKSTPETLTMAYWVRILG